MLVVPRDKRGKVGSLMNTMSMGLAPLGTVVGGLLGEFLELKIALATLFILSFVFIMICANVKGCKDLIEYSLEEEDVEVLIERTNSISS
jgi:MFS family permease